MVLMRAAATTHTVCSSTQNDPGAELSGWVSKVAKGRPQPCRLSPQRIPGRGGGWGMVATEPVKPGSALVEVPLEAMMTASTARASDRYGSVAQRLTDWQALSLHLLLERAAGDDSNWSPYISLLPQQVDHPLMWPEGWKEQLLAGSPMLERLNGRLSIVSQDFSDVMEAGGDSLLLKGGTEKLSVASFRWAAATLLSRSFSLDIETGPSDFASDDSRMAEELADLMADTWAAGDGGASEQQSLDGPQIALVPWADMLNHSSAAGRPSVLTFDPAVQAATLCAHREYQEGEEVFDSYGPSLSPWELLLDYGFVDEENVNHQAQLSWQAVANARSDANSDLLSCVEMAFGGLSIALTEGGMDDTSLACLRAASASAKDLKSVGWSGSFDPGAAMATMARLSEPLSREQELAVLETAINGLEQVLSGLKEPSAEGIPDASGGNLEWVVEQVARAKASERLAIEGTLKQLKSASGKILQGCDPKDAYIN